MVVCWAAILVQSDLLNIQVSTQITVIVDGVSMLQVDILSSCSFGKSLIMRISFLFLSCINFYVDHLRTMRKVF